MSEVAQGPGWWQASDGRWYAPERHPDYRPRPPPPPPPPLTGPPTYPPSGTLGPVEGAPYASMPVMRSELHPRKPVLKRPIVLIAVAVVIVAVAVGVWQLVTRPPTVQAFAQQAVSTLRTGDLYGLCALVEPSGDAACERFAAKNTRYHLAFPELKLARLTVAGNQATLYLGCTGTASYCSSFVGSANSQEAREDRWQVVSLWSGSVILVTARSPGASR